jgi:hypothetical protein
LNDDWLLLGPAQNDMSEVKVHVASVFQGTREVQVAPTHCLSRDFASLSKQMPQCRPYYHMQIIGRIGRLKMLNGSGVNGRERTDAEIRYMQVGQAKQGGKGNGSGSVCSPFCLKLRRKKQDLSVSRFFWGETKCSLSFHNPVALT